jgi:photosynthetic reaction center cytochrome c subunit
MDKNLISNGIWICVAGLVVAAWVILTGTPMATDTEQRGYRGTGMVDIKAEAAVAALAAQNVVPESEEPYKPEPGDELAKDVYENVPVLGDLTVYNFDRLMLAISEWVAPEQGCVYCHGEDNNFASEEFYAKRVSRRMLQMTRHINVNQKDHVGDIGVTCYTCHRGNAVPQYVWTADVAPRAGMSVGADRAEQNRPTALTGSSSLPVGALEAYLEDQQPIRVASLAPRAPNQGTADIKDTERTYALMIHLSESLGVNCTHCHNSRGFYDWSQSPQVRTIAWHGIRMVRTLNNEYVGPLAADLPPERLGPQGDAPKVNCATCHQGVAKPFGGQSMLDNWPELSTEGAPVYE